MTKIGRKLREVASNCRASLPVELAIILPLVFALVFGVIDVSRVLLARSLLDHLAVSLADDIKFNGGAAGVITSAGAEARLAAIAPNLVGGLVDVSRLNVTVSNYETLADFTSGSISAEGSLTAYRLDYIVTLITPFVNYLYSASEMTESVVLMVRNGR